jgi:hypothetical protein
MIWSEVPWRPAARTLRQFAAVWLAFVGVLAWRVGVGQGQTAAGVVLAAAAVGFGVGGLAWPALVWPLFVGLTVATLPVGWAVSRLLLAALFYGVFTPVGLLLRLLGRDALALRGGGNRTSYWAERAAVADASRYLRPF